MYIGFPTQTSQSPSIIQRLPQVYIEDDWNAALTDLTALLCNKYLAGHSKCKDLEYTGW